MDQKNLKKTFVTLTVVLLLAICFTVTPVLFGQPSPVMAYETDTDFRYPLDPGGWFLGQSFGAWNSSRSAYHLAEDLLPTNMQRELPVYAPANGQVKASGYVSGYGYVVIIEHRLSNGTYICSVLGHLKAYKLIARGAEVKKGQFIGYISNNPRENGGYTFAHLHFGIRSGSYSTVRDADGGWRYRGYAARTAIRSLWHHPTNFIKTVNSSDPGEQQAPSLKVGATKLNFGTISRGNHTNAKSYVVAGENLTDSVVIKAPSGFWISTKLWTGYQKTLTLRPHKGIVHTRIYVAFLPTVAKTYSTAVAHGIAGASTQYVRVTGRGR